jgi:DNA-binding NarL/FixJ family response regulator
MTPDHPIRLFLLSDHRLLREAFARALRSQPGILLVGAQKSSLSIAAEIVESTCEVLLLDPVDTSALATQILDHLQDAFSSLRIVMIDREAKIADVISAILSGSRTCHNLGYGEDPRRAADDGES